MSTPWGWVLPAHGFVPNSGQSPAAVNRLHVLVPNVGSGNQAGYWESFVGGVPGFSLRQDNIELFGQSGVGTLTYLHASTGPGGVRTYIRDQSDGFDEAPDFLVLFPLWQPPGTVLSLTLS